MLMKGATSNIDVKYSNAKKSLVLGIWRKPDGQVDNECQLTTTDHHTKESFEATKQKHSHAQLFTYLFLKQSKLHSIHI